MFIRTMKPEDWDEVSEIYRQGIQSGTATFTSDCPSYEDWDSAHIADCRFVAVEEDQVVGWVVLSKTSPRQVYWGVVEVSLYISHAHFGKGIGTALLKQVTQASVEMGFWCLYAAILASNQTSVSLLSKQGFRTIGHRERIAKDRFGVWQDTVLMEKRL